MALKRGVSRTSRRLAVHRGCHLCKAYQYLRKWRQDCEAPKRGKTTRLFTAEAKLKFVDMVTKGNQPKRAVAKLVAAQYDISYHSAYQNITKWLRHHGIQQNTKGGYMFSQREKEHWLHTVNRKGLAVVSSQIAKRYGIKTDSARRMLSRWKQLLEPEVKLSYIDNKAVFAAALRKQEQEWTIFSSFDSLTCSIRWCMMVLHDFVDCELWSLRSVLFLCFKAEVIILLALWSTMAASHIGVEFLKICWNGFIE